MPDPIVLAFSGGLDTSFCIPWFAETLGRPVVTVTVDTGGLDAEAAAELARRSRALGAADHLLIDAREDFFARVLRFLILGNVRRGGVYPLCVGAERVIQAQEVAKAAARLGSRTVAHGWPRSRVLPVPASRKILFTTELASLMTVRSPPDGRGQSARSRAHDGGEGLHRNKGQRS